MPKRRIGTEGSETRALIVEAAEQVIRDEGYAAASTRRVAAYAGLKPSLVHYYFPTTEDLFLAVFKRGAEQSDALIEGALTSDDPVRALWHFFIDSSRTTLSLEFVAMANHRKNIRAQIAKHSDDMRSRQAAVLQQLVGDRLESVGFTAEGLSLLMAAIGRALVMEQTLGVLSGHKDAREFVENCINNFLSNGRAKELVDKF